MELLSPQELQTRVGQCASAFGTVATLPGDGTVASTLAWSGGFEIKRCSNIMLWFQCFLGTG